MIRVMWIRLHVVILGLLMSLAAPAGAQNPQTQSNQGAVTVSTDGRVFTVTPRAPYDHLSLRIAAPDGRLFQIDGTGGAVTFQPFAIPDYTPPDGSYTWEIRLTPRGSIPADLMARARRDRESGSPESAPAFRIALARAVVVQSGGFGITDGKLLAGQGSETRPARRQQARRMMDRLDRPVVDAVSLGVREVKASAVSASSAFAVARPLNERVLFDFVIPDDLIVQGSACVGFDCVDGESFGFDTIRLKENNLRIKFEDTSVSPFPTNDWQLIANDSASGGLSKFSIDDVTSVRTPFTVEAGTPTNSLYMDSTGNVGFGTATPVLDLHANTGDTPAFRMEQNSSGGFTAQTWDVAGNEANWFVRDVTGGSRLPLRIRPGAPTSSIDISATGNVGIGTAAPQTQLHVNGTATGDTFIGIGPNPGGTLPNASALNIGHAGTSLGRAAGFFNVRPDPLATAPNPSLRFLTANVERMIITNTGNLGLGVSNPSNPIQAASGAFLSAGGTWTNASSREMKDEVESLAVAEAQAVLAGLNPVKFVYLADRAEHHVGFIAEDVPDLVATKDRKGMSPMDVVAVLTRIVQEQQRQIADLTAKVSALETARRR